MVSMTIKELKEKIQSFPDDAEVELDIEIKVNAQSTPITRSVDSIEYCNKNNTISFKSWWGIRLFY